MIPAATSTPSNANELRAGLGYIFEGDSIFH